MKTIKFREWNCVLKKAYYGNGRIALELIDADDGEVVARATVNIPEQECASDEAFIKDWSENEGMVDALTEAGVIGPMIDAVHQGHVVVTKHKLLI